VCVWGGLRVEEEGSAAVFGRSSTASIKKFTAYQPPPPKQLPTEPLPPITTPPPIQATPVQAPQSHQIPKASAPHTHLQRAYARVDVRVLPPRELVRQVPQLRQPLAVLVDGLRLRLGALQEVAEAVGLDGPEAVWRLGGSWVEVGWRLGGGWVAEEWESLVGIGIKHPSAKAVR